MTNTITNRETWEDRLEALSQGESGSKGKLMDKAWDGSRSSLRMTFINHIPELGCLVTTTTVYFAFDDSRRQIVESTAFVPKAKIAVTEEY